MKEIDITAESTKDSIEKIQEHIGGIISEQYGLYTLDIDNDIAKGCIRFITFDWGVSLIEYNLIYFDDILLVTTTSKFNPLYFMYCSQGSLRHRFETQNEFSTVKEFHSAILTTSQHVDHQTLFPKGIHLIINIISIERVEFLKKRLNNLAQLNKTLHKIFVDLNSEVNFAFYGPIDIKMEKYVKRLRNIPNQNISESLLIEGSIYQLLALHIERHDKLQEGHYGSQILSDKELKIIRRTSHLINRNPSKNFSLEQLEISTGLNQAKLQKGFQFMFAKTVTEYIRHIRLETARDLMLTTDLNISQIVYSVGLTSRSYFSKIFKDKYGITPNEYRMQIVTTI